MCEMHILIIIALGFVIVYFQPLFFLTLNIRRLNAEGRKNRAVVKKALDLFCPRPLRFGLGQIRIEEGR